LKRFNKKRDALIVFSLIIITPICSIVIGSFTPLNGAINNLYHLKSSAPYTSISINDLSGSLNNWSWAETQPWFGGGSGTELDPYILENLIVDGNLTDSCISISNSNASFIIQNCELFNSSSGGADGGIYLNNVENGIISDNYFFNHRNAAIYGTASDHIIVSENTLKNHHHGVYLGGNYNQIISNSLYGDGTGSGIVYYDVYHNNIIEGNTIENCWQGMFIFNADNNTFVNNIANNNLQHGIALTSTANYNFLLNNIASNNTLSGIIIDNSVENVIERTRAIGNHQHGIYLTNADHSTIYNNRLINNIIDGINLDTGSTNNLIYHNYFGNNSRHAFDDGALNEWNSTTIGNFWDNHTGPDTTPVDGIVDNPYLYIEGGAGSIDYLPIAEDGPPELVIDSPNEGDTFGNNAPNFIVMITDTFPEDMWYSFNGGMTQYFFTTNGTIDQTAWNALPEGLVTINFYVNDTTGNLTSESIKIFKALPDNNLIIIIIVVSIISAVAVATIAFFLIRMRKAREKV
jgi:parallel beta-helix repeat protein